jgi:hypothetical protein
VSTRDFARGSVITDIDVAASFHLTGGHGHEVADPGYGHTASVRAWAAPLFHNQFRDG